MNFETLNSDLTVSMKNKDANKVLALRTVISEIKNVAIKNGRKEPTSDDVITALTKAVKQREDSIESFKVANRQDLVDSETFQLQVYKSYLPTQMNDSEVSELVNNLIESLGINSKKDFGKIMKELNTNYKGKLDLKKVNQILTEKFN